MGAIVRKANKSVRRHCTRATVVSKIASAKQEGSDVLGVMMLGQLVEEAWDVWVEEADSRRFSG